MNVSVDSLNYLSQSNCTSDFVKAGSDHKVCFVVVVVGNILKKEDRYTSVYTYRGKAFPQQDREGRISASFLLPVVVSTTAVVESSQQ